VGGVPEQRGLELAIKHILHAIAHRRWRVPFEKNSREVEFPLRTHYLPPDMCEPEAVGDGPDGLFIL
jgi:hypothetical protein